MTGRGAALALLAAAAACAAAPPNASAVPGAPEIAGRDAVVRVGAYAIVPALAVSANRLFVVGEDGIAIYDRGARRWLAPVPLELRWPGARAGRIVAATNLIGDAVWVAGAGRVFVVNPNLRATFAATLDGEPRDIRVARGGASAYVLTDRWWEVGATGSASPAELPPRAALLDAPGAGDPALRRAVDDPLLTRDGSLRNWPVLAVARGATPSDVWLGTAGGGVFHVDVDFHRSEQLAFGLRSGPVAALVRSADGILVAEQPAMIGTGPAVVTEGSDDLARWRWHALADQVGPIRAVALRGRMLCVAGETGSGLVDLAASGLPATLVRADQEPAGVAIASRDGCVVGTWRGVVVIPWQGASDSVRRSDPTPPVAALAASGDTVWAGTRDGLVTIVRGRALGIAHPIPAGDAIVALALVPDGVAVATESEVAIVASGATQRLTLPLRAVGRVTALAADDRTLWIGGTSGALALTLATRAATSVPLAPPGEAPPLGGLEVRAIVLSPGVAWIGTAAGLARIRRAADGLPR